MGSTNIPTSFDAFVVLGQGQGKSSSGGSVTGSLLKPRIEVTASDTVTTLKRKRNNGCCEFPGCKCDSLAALEWHHHFKTEPAERRWEEKVGGGCTEKSAALSKQITPMHTKLTLTSCKNARYFVFRITNTHTHTHTHTHTPAKREAAQHSSRHSSSTPR
jgi:hypothetical protein